jgi:pyridoxamine 5'-phosphate oxidase family protein
VTANRSVFTDAERRYLSERRLGRIATVGKDGTPHVAPVGWSDDLASVDPWRPRGIEIRGSAEVVDDPPRIRIRPRRVVSWGLDNDDFFERHARTVD